MSTSALHFESGAGFGSQIPGHSPLWHFGLHDASLIRQIEFPLGEIKLWPGSTPNVLQWVCSPRWNWLEVIHPIIRCLRHSFCSVDPFLLYCTNCYWRQAYSLIMGFFSNVFIQICSYVFLLELITVH